MPESAARSGSFNSNVSSHSQYRYAATIVSQTPAVSSLKVPEASREALEDGGVRIKQFIRVQGGNDYYLLGSEDGSTRKATIKTAMK